MEYSENSFNRLSIALIEKNGFGAEEALQQLKSFKVRLRCGEAIRSSVPLQAAFLTAVNTAARAFLGGVQVELPADVICLLPWPGAGSLNAIALELGANFTSELEPGLLTLHFGTGEKPTDEEIVVWATDWRGGVFTESEVTPVNGTGLLPLGGVYAGGLAVALAFLKTAKIQPQALDKTTGISLWRPDLNWLAKDAEGPADVAVPTKLWLLGLGHLGQAYLWTLGLLPFPASAGVEFFLQDHDKAVEANLSAGLLCTADDVDQLKTRICADWLAKRGLATRLIERKYDLRTVRGEGEPYVALCGFDNAYSRSILENAGFDLVVEAGLGDSLENFDKIMLHTFPSEFQTAEKVWGNFQTGLLPKERVLQALSATAKKVCGILELTIAGKAVSSSFVGACAASLAVAELLRARNGGLKIDKLVTQLRVPDDTRVGSAGGTYTTELGRSSYQELSILQVNV
jgi:hypothetical protein